MGCLGLVLSGFIAYAIHDSWIGALILSALTVGVGFWADSREKARAHVYGFCAGSAIGYTVAVLDDHTVALLIAALVSAGMAWLLRRSGDDDPDLRQPVR